VSNPQPEVGEEGSQGDRNKYISFEEFKEIHQKIYDSTNNPKDIFNEGFRLLDKNE
jgi:hypothetical protein